MIGFTPWKEPSTADSWSCVRCGCRYLDLDFNSKRLHYITLPDAPGQWTLFCSPCWKKSTLYERLNAYAERANPEYPWQDIADAVWKGLTTDA